METFADGRLAKADFGQHTRTTDGLSRLATHPAGLPRPDDLSPASHVRRHRPSHVTVLTGLALIITPSARPWRRRPLGVGSDAETTCPRGWLTYLSFPGRDGP